MKKMGLCVCGGVGKIMTEVEGESETRLVKTY